MTPFPYALSEDAPKRVGLIVLQADETLESDFRRLTPESLRLLVSRVPSGREVTPTALQEMEGRLTAAAALLPREATFDAVGYGCTSGAAQIGVARIAELVRDGVRTRAVAEPVSALVAACRATGVGRLAILSPYVEAVSERLREAVLAQGVETPAFGSFAEPEEARVARIEPASVIAAAKRLTSGAAADALFLSCTNLRTLEVIEPLERMLGMPVFSSNQVLAWRLLALAGAPPGPASPGMLFSRAP